MVRSELIWTKIHPREPFCSETTVGVGLVAARQLLRQCSPFESTFVDYRMPWSCIYIPYTWRNVAFAFLQGPACGPTEQTLESERITTDNKSFITRIFNGTDRAPRDGEKQFQVCLFHYFDFDLRSLLDTLWDGDDNLKLGIREFGSSDFAFSPLLDYNFHYQLFSSYFISFHFISLFAPKKLHDNWENIEM